MSDLSLDAQLAHAVKLFNRTSNAWPALQDLVQLTSTTSTSSIAITPTTEDKDVPPSESALSALTELSANASHASLISANETLDEIATSHLKYLLLPLLLAHANEDVQGDSEKRLSSLTSSLAFLQQFFESMSNLSILSPNDKETVMPDEDDVEAVAQAAGTTREEKIRRYKAEKTAANKLSALLSRGRDVDDDLREEITREATLVMLQCGVIRGVNLHQSINREIPLLKWAMKQHAKGENPSEKAQDARRNTKVPLPVPAIPHQTFRIVSEREGEREKVFRPSHNLPTYTVEEWGEIEAQRAAEKAKETHEGEIRAKRRAEEEDSDGEEAFERKRKEESRWDDWKDDHNPGSGNTTR